MTPVRIVAIGTPHGDDALAWKVLELVAKQFEPSGARPKRPVMGGDSVAGAPHPRPLSPGVPAARGEFHRLDGAQRLLDILDGRGTWHVIDALAPAGAPGHCRRFRWPDATVAFFRPGSTHQLGLAETLALAETLGMLPPRVVLWGIEAETVEPGTPLSVRVLDAIPRLAGTIVEELQADAVAATMEGVAAAREHHGTMMNDNIFKKIIDGQIPAKIIHQDDCCIAFHDINPQAPVHVLIIPRQEIRTHADLTEADRELLGHLHLVAGKLAEQLGVGDGYRVVVNCKERAGQTVPHLHFHLLGGRDLHWPPG